MIAAPDPRAWTTWDSPAGVPDTALLGLIAAAAAEQARQVLAGTPADPVSPLADAVRLLAGPDGPAHVAAASQRTGLSEEDLRRLVLAHRHGGTHGVAAAVDPSDCGAEELAAAVAEVRRRRLLSSGDLDVQPGSITDEGAGIRVRLGPDGRWYPFTAARGQWWPAPGAQNSAGAAYAAAVRARATRRTG